MATTSTPAPANGFAFPKEPPLPPIGATGQQRISGSNEALESAVTAGATTVANIVDDFAFPSKLTNVEAQRVISVLQEAQRKVQLLGMIPEEIDRKIVSMFTPDTIAVLTEYRNHSNKYKSLVEKKETGAGKNIEAEVREAAKQLRSATRSLCRHFSQNPAAFTKLKYLKSKSAGNAQFEQLLQDVKMIFYNRLKTTVEEEKAKQDQLSIIIAKEQKTSSEVKALRTELDKAKKERTAEVNKRNEVIRRLKEELRGIKQQAEETTKRLESRSKQKEDQELQQAREKEAAMSREISTQTANLENNIKQNREDEANLRKKKYKVESEVENWIHKYDQDMEEKQAELEDITAIYMEEKAQLDELQQRYNELQKEYDSIMEEQRRRQEAKLEEERQLRRMHDAATVIQAIWRGFYVRLQAKRKAQAKPDKKKKK